MVNVRESHPETRSGLWDYSIRFKNCFPEDSRVTRYAYDNIIVRNVRGLPGYEFRVGGPRQETGYIADLPEDIVSIAIPPQDGKPKSLPEVHPIYPQRYVELAIVESKGKQDIDKKVEKYGMDTLVAWLDGHVYWRRANISIGTVHTDTGEDHGYVWLEKVVWGDNENGKPVAYRTDERYPGKKAIVINTKRKLDDAPETITELVRALHIDNRRNGQ